MDRSVKTGGQIWMLWDEASYHKGQEIKDYLVALNEELEEKDWKIQLIEFEKDAPEQNLVEDIWLKGKKLFKKKLL